ARSRTLPTHFEAPREALPWLIEENLSSALIFGPEDRGLSNSELNFAQRFLTIPANPDYPSLNLAQAVAVCAYELHLAAIAPATQITEENSDDLASIDLLEGYYEHLERTLLKIRYLFPHTAVSRMEKFRRIFNRAALSREELAMLRGILRQVEWSLQQETIQD
ncbi:MAG: RNA methyltransferase, partial [Chloroflexaceae bacterium]|nr:RNA methyltransferase [Chloroflexaceae bacterium]